MASQTWAQRAKTAALDDSTPPPPPARQTPQSNAPAPISKASSSDNWRAGSSRGVPSTGGWIKEEKKEKKGRRPSLSATPRESTQRRHHQSSSSSGTTTQAKKVVESTSTSWAAADPTDALPSPTFAPVDLSTTASSSNPTDSSSTLPVDDLIPSLNTPSDSTSSTEPISGSGLSEAPSTSTLPAIDSLPPPPLKEKLPAPLPKVNVWSVRKDQLAAAATPVPAAPSSTVPTSAAPHKEKRAAKENSHTNTSSKGSAAKRNATNSAKSSASSSASPAPTPSAHAPTSSTPSPLASLDPLPNAARTGSAPSPAPRRGDGWSGSGLRELASGAAPVGDRESWPAPNEEVPVVKEKSKKAKAAAAKAAEQGLEEAAPKKKGDKTKWIAIKVDIRHAGTPSTRAAPAAGEKRVKAPRRDGAVDAPKAGGAVGATSTGAGDTKATTKAANGASAAAGAATTAPVANGKKSTPATRPSPPTGPSTDSRRPLPADFPQKPSTSTLPASLVNPPLLSNGTNSAPGAVLRPFSNRTPNVPGTSEPRQSGPTPPNPSKRSDLVDPTAATPTQPARDFAPNAFRAAAPRGGRGGSVRGRGVNNRAAYPVRTHVVDTVVPYASYTPDLAAAAFYPAQSGVPTFPAQSVAPPLLDPYTLDPTRYWLLGQLEWYMSVDNLCRDMFLRTKMDDQGWIEISVIANFNRIKNLTSDHAIVRETMGLTPILEVFGDFVRVRAHWPEWVLPNALPSRVDAKAVAEAAAVTTLGGEQPASPGKNGEEGAASHGHSSEDDEEGTAPTTVSTGSQAGEEAPIQKVAELDQVATELATVTAA